ncbi:hypothetical protein Bca4012_008927 [Brassica carinata]
MSTTNAPETAINELTTDELTTKALNKRYEGLLTVRARVVKGKGAWYWTHLVRNTDTNLPKAVKLRCSLCDAVFSASNPSRTVSLPSWILRGSASSTLFLLRRIQSFELFSPISSKRDFAAARLDVKYKEANSETESRIRDAIQIASEGVEGVELNGSDAAVRKSRMVVEGYDGSTDRTDVEEALIKHFASRGIKLIHVSVPEVDKTHTILCRCGLIYLNEEDEEKALKFDGSVMGGRMLRVTAYPFENNRLDHFFSTTEAQDKNLLRALKVTGFDTSLARDVLEEMVRAVFPQSEPEVLWEALKL